MSLTDVTLDLNARLVARLYDEHHGYYLLMRLVDGHYRAERPLSRDEALTYYCASDEILRHVYPWTPRKQRRRGAYRTQTREREG